jgi:hypothetical protein
VNLGLGTAHVAARVRVCDGPVEVEAAAKASTKEDGTYTYDKAA